MAIVVHKYGGTSVGSAERIRAIADRVARAHRSGDQLLVVVSAMGETTNHLMGLAREISASPSQRELDMLLTAGERITMALLALALQEHDLRAISFTGSQSGIITDDRHGRARITEIRPYRLREALDAGAIVIVAGFQGVSQKREITTLGRGGSDTTAVALACEMDAPCIIYTDVAGVFSADPRIVPDARPLARIDSRVLSRLTHLGSQVVHPRAVNLAAKFRVRLEIRSSFEEGEGTVMVHDTPMEGPVIQAVTCRKQMTSIEICGQDAVRGSLPAMLQSLASLELPLDNLVIREGEKVSAVSWTLSHSDAGRLEAQWDRLEKPSPSWQIHSRTERAVVSLVGSELCQDADVVLTAVRILEACDIAVEQIQSESSAVSLTINEADADRAVRELHEKMIEKAVKPDRLQTGS